MTIEQYIDNINKRYKLGNATEHTFRVDLQQLIESLVPTTRATNEPKRQSCGAPDYILTKKDIPAGFIEAKDIGDKDLDGAKKTGNKEQFDHYKASLNNLIFTDYLDFHLYREGQFVTKIAIGEVTEKGIKPIPENFGGGQMESKIRKIYIFVIFVLSYFTSFSQNIDIQGIIVDSLTKEPVVFATIFITDAKDSVFFHTYSDENGIFKLILPENTTATFNARLIGYKTKVFSDNFNEYVGGIRINLAPEAIILSELTIIDSTTKVIHKIDRDIHKVTSEQTKQAKTIYDILRTLPGVVVDESNNSIRFKGSAPEILVNNMPASYVYPDLKQIDINDIQNIELIDKSSIYGGAGEGGIINLKFKPSKKEKSLGMYLGIDWQYMPIDNVFQPNINVLNINGKIGNTVIFNNIFYNDYTGIDTITGNGTLSFNDQIYSRVDNNLSIWSQKSIFDVFGIMYNRNNFSFMLVDNFQFTSWLQKKTVFQENISEDYFYRSVNQQEENGKNYYFFNNIYGRASLQDYKKQDFEWAFSLLNSLFSHPQTNEIITNSTIIQNQIENTSSQKMMYKSLWACYMFQTEIQYRWRITQNSQLGITARYSYANSPLNSKNYFLNDVEHHEFYQNSNFHMNILPVNINFAQRFGKFSYDLTAKYKFQQFKGTFQRNINSIDSTFLLNMPFHNFEPSIRLKYKINSFNDLHLGYSYTSGDLETNDWTKQVEYYVPYIDQSNPLSWYSGNSEIQMEDYHKVYFQYRLTKDKLNFTSEIFFTATQNGLSYIKIPISTGIDMYKYLNYIINYRTGTDLMFYWKISESWNVWANGKIYHSITEGNVKSEIAELYDIDDIKQNNFECNGNFGFQYFPKSKIGKKPSINFWGNAYSKEISVVGYSKPYLTISTAFSTYFFKEKLYFAIQIDNLLSPFIKRKSHYEYAGYKLDYKTNSLDDNLTISVKLGLNLFKGDRGTKDIR